MQFSSSSEAARRVFGHGKVRHAAGIEGHNHDARSLPALFLFCTDIVSACRKALKGSAVGLTAGVVMAFNHILFCVSGTLAGRRVDEKDDQQMDHTTMIHPT